MKSRVVVIHANKKPTRGVVNPRPHQLYRDSRVSIETRELKDLDPNNIHHHSYLLAACVGSITGFRYLSYIGYILALDYFPLSS
jgi:hypothetical protein